jgi:hypothetical protein
LCGKPADSIYRTRRGFHIIWRNLEISAERSMVLRDKLSDDRIRMKLDTHGNRLRQVLFDTKIYRVYEIPEDEDGERKLVKQETFKRQKIR